MRICIKKQKWLPSPLAWFYACRAISTCFSPAEGAGVQHKFSLVCQVLFLIFITINKPKPSSVFFFLISPSTLFVSCSVSPATSRLRSCGRCTSTSRSCMATPRRSSRAKSARRSSTPWHTSGSTWLVSRLTLVCSALPLARCDSHNNTILCFYEPVCAGYSSIKRSRNDTPALPPLCNVIRFIFIKIADC